MRWREEFVQMIDVYFTRYFMLEESMIIKKKSYVRYLDELDSVKLIFTYKIESVFLSNV